MDMDSQPCDMFVDISDDDCTTPDSKLGEALEVLEAGKVLMAVAQRHSLQSDVRAYCQQMQLELVDQGGDEQQVYFLIRK